MRIEFHDKDFEKAYNKLKKKLPKGESDLGATTNDDRYWFVTVTSDIDPGARLSLRHGDRRGRACSTGRGRTCRSSTSPR